MNQNIKVFSNTDELFKTAALDFCQRATTAVHRKGNFLVALSGGNTPKLLFDRLCTLKNIPWSNIKFFFGDERYVSEENAENNYRIASEFLFSKVPVNEKNIFRIPTEFSDPNEAAHHYEKILRQQLYLTNSEIPQFDLVYLGLGDNAHTASLMPSSDVVKHYSEIVSAREHDPLVVSLWVPELSMYRITLTPPLINNSEAIVFLVIGKDKQNAVWEVLEGPYDPIHYPAQLIHCKHEKTLWFLDKNAADKLTIID